MTLSTLSLVPISHGEDLAHRRNGLVGPAEGIED